MAANQSQQSQPPPPQPVTTESLSKTSTPTTTARWPKLLTLDSANVANPSLKWRLGSRFVVPSVGLFSSAWMNLANSSTVHHAAVLYEALNQNYLASRATRARSSFWFFSNNSSSQIERRPLLTYSNHASCLDDPLMWGALIPLRWQFNSDRHRWSGAAAEVCFSKRWHSIFFSLGKTFPIIRGEGIYQPAMDYAARLMRAGQWLHFFPEGKVIPRPENSDPDLLLFRFDDQGRPVDLRKIREAEEAAREALLASATKGEGEQKAELSFTDSFFRSKLTAPHSHPASATPPDSLVADYSLKWGIARLIIEHVLGEGSGEDRDYGRYHESGKDLQTSQGSQLVSLEENLEASSSTNDVLPEVDLLPIYHIGMDDVLPTKKPYVPRLFQRVTFLVRPEGPIRIDRDFLLRLFGEEHSAAKRSLQSSALSLTEKRIRLMAYLEEELNSLKDKAQWLHDRLQQPLSASFEEVKDS